MLSSNLESFTVSRIVMISATIVNSSVQLQQEESLFQKLSKNYKHSLINLFHTL